MKVLCLLMLATCCLFLTPQNVSAQASASAQPTSEQSLQELVKEVRQLRATLQRMNASLYKGQVMLERVKLQQEQVMRTSNELREVRENLNEARIQQSRMKALLGRVEAGVETGVKSDTALTNLKVELETMFQREHRLMMRESQLANELQLESAKLNDLNDKLNALVEIEMSPR